MCIILSTFYYRREIYQKVAQGDSMTLKIRNVGINRNSTENSSGREKEGKRERQNFA